MKKSIIEICLRANRVKLWEGFISNRLKHMKEFFKDEFNEINRSDIIKYIEETLEELERVKENANDIEEYGIEIKKELESGK